ncbi:uncharacterized protein LOC119719735 [Patiria miniata]|uniref:Uncharacterized protein n=1 Tax=Patiria miniata TaxID=46514 RepID=A0A913Z379_PATMI|nr:uncharacterized protein LOC119719735 [Patiria miniata]
MGTLLKQPKVSNAVLHSCCIQGLCVLDVHEISLVEDINHAAHEEAKISSSTQRIGLLGTLLKQPTVSNAVLHSCCIQGLCVLDVHEISLVEDINHAAHEEAKISSSTQRIRLLGTLLKQPTGLCVLDVHEISLVEDINHAAHEEAKISSSTQRIGLLGTLLKQPKVSNAVLHSCCIQGLCVLDIHEISLVEDINHAAHEEAKISSSTQRIGLLGTLLKQTMVSF